VVPAPSGAQSAFDAQFVAAYATAARPASAMYFILFNELNYNKYRMIIIKLN